VAKNKTSGEERRVFPRKTLRTKIVFEDEKGEGFIYFYSTDISEGGIFFEHDVPLKMGTKIFLSFRLPNQQLIRTTGEIVRQAQPPEITPVRKNVEVIIGMGIRFLDLEQEHRHTIRHFIEQDLPTTG